MKNIIKKVLLALGVSGYGVGIPIVFKDYFVWLATTPQGQFTMVDTLPLVGWIIGFYVIIHGVLYLKCH